MKKTIAAAVMAALLMGFCLPGFARINEVVKTGATTVEIRYDNGQKRLLDFYSDGVVRMFQDPDGGPMRDPVAKPEAKILVDNPRKDLTEELAVSGTTITLGRRTLAFDAETGLLRVTMGEREVLHETAPALIEPRQTVMHIAKTDGECFYGGGMQNGRFSHGGKIIQIVNTNNWTDGGVASPTPFFWSTNGYGMMFYTFHPGRYDFGATTAGETILSHDTGVLDVFLMIEDREGDLRRDFYQLTGYPVLLPKFGFYEGHLNAYNRDYWSLVPDAPNAKNYGDVRSEFKGVLFEDGKYYTESSKKTAGAIHESLNGELTDSAGRSNYAFSARAVIDRYAAHDMPLGWILPNDGYGAGYGQTGTVDGNIDNLRQFGDYARSHGVELGLWTQSDLHPKEGVEPLLQRDIVREVNEAGVRVLKTDVAWVGAGYSFGLNGTSDVAAIMPQQGNGARPFIISLDGWAGTQRNAGIWSGDQTGGQWEYIRFHIPTYIGSGLSGQPNVGSDMDGIFGGRNLAVNVRDFEWKTFTPMELNMDGWGANEKYPHALGKKGEDINRKWLKLKSSLIPYTYTIAHEAAIGGMPMLRSMTSMFRVDDRQQIDDLTKYQFMYGPSILVAPIYEETRIDADGNDIRNGIWLPEGKWLDPYTNEFIEGGCMLNSYDAPLDRLPVFLREGSIIPFTEAHNQPRDINDGQRTYEIVPGNAIFTEYDDDGTTTAWQRGEYVETEIESQVHGGTVLVIWIQSTTGKFAGFNAQKTTTLRIHTGRTPRGVVVKNLTTGKQMKPKMNYENSILSIDIPKMDIAHCTLQFIIDGIMEMPLKKLAEKPGQLSVPDVTCATTAYSITPSWGKDEHVDYCEIMFNGLRYTTLREGSFVFDGLKPETTYDFQIRSVNADGTSEWKAFSATTDANPLEFAVQGITATTSCKNQGGQGINKLFDFDESTVWHTAWGEKAVPFTINADLGCTIQLDKLQYLPRDDAGNGTLLEGTITYSRDGKEWSEPQSFSWAAESKAKEMAFSGAPSARYLRIDVTRGRGDFGSGTQLYVFRVPGSEVLLPGDINRDGRVDMDDFTSYMNYTGLRAGDPDFDGYVSVGDVDYNGRIDAYDISVVATKVHGGAEQWVEKFDGSITLPSDKPAKLKAGDEFTVEVRGKGLSEVNAFSLAIPYNAEDLEFVAAEPIAAKGMENMTYDRLHANGEKVLYPTFVNVGDAETLDGDGPLATLKFRARRACTVTLQPRETVLVDKMLHVIRP